ncbi:MAG: DHHA1 domain-containing protein [Candidatus Pacearchaeota archaeon]|nr:DHHA1 domain-containing protein [Candidatus Pacearchaeota archaeon]
MLTKKQIKEIKEHLEKAQNPIFFFDNDPDGLCSFLLLQKYCGKGKGVAIKSFPEMNADYFRKVNELNADYIFILDKPVVSKEFFDEVNSFNIPIVWIDHHEIDKSKIPDFVHYYNPLFNKLKKNEPVTYLCYKISERKEDLWIAVAGCISDRFIPEYYSEFEKTYPDLAFKSKDAFDIFYKSEIGKIVKLFCFGLKDRTSNVIGMIRFLLKAKTPYEVLEETNNNKNMHVRFKQVYKKYQKLMEKAKAGIDESKFLFFQYAGDLSMSADLANELTYLFPSKIVVVIYLTGIKANISIRGKKIRDLVLKAIQGLEGATGGGHENAVGAKVKIEDLEKFREKLEDLAR